MNDRQTDQPPESKPQAAVTFGLAPIGRRRRRRPDLGLSVVVLAVVLVAAAIIRPWGDGNQMPTALTGPLASTVPSPPPSAAAPPPSPSPGPSPNLLPAEAISLARSAAARVILNPSGHADTWGIAVGAAGGPDAALPFEVSIQLPIVSTAVDGSWSAWAPLRPEPSARPVPGDPIEPPEVNPTNLCRGLPSLPSGAQVVALTAPSSSREVLDIAAWQVVGWHDEPRDIEALPAVDRLTTFNAGAIEYLELPDGSAWPDGRYQFLLGGSSTTSLSVCFGRP
ncbi:MAG: hypothetical protein ACRDGQ_14595 [Candidatus Limnocylindrales bacterium]